MLLGVPINTNIPIIAHPMPAHVGQEISPGLLENPKSVVFDQAENRLHIQKAILTKLIS